LAVIEFAKTFTPSSYKDDFRAADASSYGGFQTLDKEISTRLRSAGYELVKMAGK